MIQRVVKPLKKNHGNHPPEGSDKELIYEKECAKTYLDRWRHILKYPIVHEHYFTDEEKETLVEAINIGAQTGMLSSLHREELNEIAERIKLPQSDKGFFCRFNGASPKDGRFDWPMISAQDVIRQVATSWRAFQCLNRGDQTLYFCKFDPEWDERRELRVFCHKGKVTAISQYCLSFVEPWSTMSDEELQIVVRNVKQVVHENYESLSEACCESFVIDCYIEQDLSARIIELNAFGYWLPAGSGLFHWLDDRQILYNQGDETIFRVLEE